MTGMNELNYSFVTREDTKTFLENPLSVREDLKKVSIRKKSSRVLYSSLKYGVYNWHDVKVMILLRLYVSPDVVFISETVFIT